MTEVTGKHDLAKTFKVIYMYLVALISVVVFIIGTVTLLNTALKTWVFPTNGYYYNDYTYNCTAEGMKGGSFTNREVCVAYYEDLNKKNAVNQRNEDLSFGVAMALVSLPIWLLHMAMIKKDKKHEIA